MRKSALLFFIFFLSLFSYFLFLPNFVSAQEKNTTVPPSNTNPDVPNNLHNWTQNVMIEVMSALTCQLAGVDPTNPKQSCLGIDSTSGKIGFLPSTQTGGAIGFMGNMIATLYTPPLHTSDYFQNLAQNFGINKKAYAQNAGGTGFQGLTPLIGIWSAFRNIVYLILVIVFVVIGLAIMLRIKIDPRTVMTIQNQIPKIIVGILVVTFSFAIAGFLIDLMWTFIYLIFNIFAGIDPKIKSDLISDLQGSNAVGFFSFNFGISKTSWAAAGGFGSILASLLDNPGGKVLTFIIGAVVGAPLAVATFGVSSIVTAIAGAVFSTEILQFTGRIIAFFIIGIALLVGLFRLWFALLMAYIHILIDVVLAPFWIIGGIVPGSPISLSGWLRDLIANLAAFPAVIAMFMLGKVFIDVFGETQTQGQFVPPLIGNPGGTNAIGALIGLGIILMTPNVVNMLKTALKAPKIDTGIGKAIGVGVGTPGRLIGGAGSTALSPHYDKAGKLVYPGGTMGRFLRGFGFVK